MAWKAIKVYAKIQGIECYSPRESFKEAYRLKLIDYDEKWMKMVKDRNLCVHLYSEEYADEIYKKLPNYLKLFKQLLDNLKNKK